MSDPFLSSDEYDERAHQLYNEGQYDEAIDTLREGLGLYPHAVELHVGMGYARLAREEYAWARRSFEEARGLDPDHEDTLAGLGEVLRACLHDRDRGRAPLQTSAAPRRTPRAPAAHSPYPRAARRHAGTDRALRAEYLSRRRTVLRCRADAHVRHIRRN